MSSSGDLLANTYVPETSRAWHWHDTYGRAFGSCAVVAEGSEDALYVIVRRTIDGSIGALRRTPARPAFHRASDCWFSGLRRSSIPGRPPNTVTGADWLEGCTVAILADGAVVEPQVVTAGAFSCPTTSGGDDHVRPANHRRSRDAADCRSGWTTPSGRGATRT